MIAAIYVRVSTDEQAREGLSLAVQEERCRAAAEADGATDVRVYCDDGYSGTTLLRPGLQQLLADLAGHDALYVLSTDRLCRNATDFGLLIRTFAEAEVEIRPVTDALDLDSAGGRMSAQVRAVVDEFQVAQTREKINASLQHRIESGLHHGKAPYGYRIPVGSDGMRLSREPLVIEPTEARVVRRIYDRYARRGWAMRRIARSLNGSGVPTIQSSAVWRPTSLRRILTNATYIGLVPWHGETFPGEHEPIVREGIWWEAQTRMRRNAGVPARAQWSLGPVYRCGLCGGAMVTKGGDNRGSRSYVCRTRLLLEPADRHPTAPITIAKGDALVWAYTRWLLGDGDVVQAAAREALARLADDGSRSGPAEELLELRERMAGNADLFDAGALTRELLLERNRPLVLRAGELEMDERRLSGSAAADLELLSEADGAVVERLMSCGDVMRQREFLMAVYEAVEVWGDRLLFVSRWGLEDAAVAVPRYYSPSRMGPISLEPWTSNA